MTRSTEDLKKMIATLLDESGRTEAEMATARRTAARLMAKHGLTEDEVLADNPDLVTFTTELGRYEWLVAKACAFTVGKVTGTRPTYQVLNHPITGRRTDKKEQRFSGYRPDVEQAMWLFGHVVEKARVGAAAHKGDRAKSDYIVAFGATVSRRLRALVVEVEEVRGETANALVVQKDAIIDDFMGETGKDRSRRRELHDAAAAAAGRRDGESVSLHRAVGDGPLAIGKG